MVRGRIRPPAVRISNPKIVLRHLHAEALAEFFRCYPELFKDQIDSVFSPESDVPGKMLGFLEARPANLLARLRTVVPSSLHSVLGIDNWSWLGDSADSESFSGRLNQAAEDIRRDWQLLAKAMQDAAAANRFRNADRYQKQLNTLRRRSLLGKLGTYGLMPKYGFPTEVVQLKLRSSSREAGQVELERDMKLALTEFAPENQVVAASRVWTSEAIVLPIGDRKLHEYWYWSCPRCHYFSTEPAVAVTDEEVETRDCYCGEAQPAQKYVYPEFGFSTASKGGDRVGDSRPPAKSYASSFFFDDSNERNPQPVESCPWVHVIQGSEGWIHVINDNRGRHFYICMACGCAARLHPSFVRGGEGTHRRPWSSEDVCNGHMVKRALGYRYRTDVVELRFPAPRSSILGPFSLGSFWLSLLYATVNAACLALDIDQRDIDGCLHYAERGLPSLILFDSSPGGAGLVFSIRDNLEDVLRRTRSLVSCTSCAEDSSCVACLRTYSNQRFHNELRRGPVLEYLESHMR